MIRVRYPNGQCLKYKKAQNVVYSSHAWELRADDGEWIASVQLSAGAIVEAVFPCEVSNPIADIGSEQALKRSVEVLQMQRIPPRSRRDILEIKRLLRNFDARTGSWK